MEIILHAVMIQMNLIDFKEIFISDDFKSFHLQVAFFNYECIKNQGGGDFNELVALFIH